MDGWMDERMSGWMVRCEWVGGWGMGRWMDGWMDG